MPLVVFTMPPPTACICREKVVRAGQTCTACGKVVGPRLPPSSQLRRALLVSAILVTGCPGPFWTKICLGGTTTPSEACIVADAFYAGAAGATPPAVVGGAVGALALNHDLYNSFSDSLEANKLSAVDAGTGASQVDAGPVEDAGAGR